MPANQQQNERHPAFVVTVHIDCIGAFTHENHGPLTAVATVFLAIFTTTLWWVTRKVVKSQPQIERAYVSAGFGASERDTGALFCKGSIMTGKRHVPSTIFPSPFANLENLPAQPVYPERRFVNYSIPPNHRNFVAQHVWAFRTFPQVEGDEIFYGRIWYTDIFGTGHYSSFCPAFE